MASKTHRCPCRIQGHVFIRFSGSTLSRLLSSFFSDQDKLTGAPALSLRPVNIPAIAFAIAGALLKVYTNEKI